MCRRLDSRQATVVVRCHPLPETRVINSSEEGGSHHYEWLFVVEPVWSQITSDAFGR
jgi:hypothetical protein